MKCDLTDCVHYNKRRPICGECTTDTHCFYKPKKDRRVL